MRIKRTAKAIGTIGAILMLMQTQAHCQTNSKADALQRYRNGDYKSLMAMDIIPVNSDSYLKVAYHSIISTQVLMYKLILKGTLQAYRDENCDSAMSTAQWENVINKSDSEMVTVLGPYDSGCFDGDPTTFYLSFYADGYAQWSYAEIKGSNTTPRIERKKLNDKRVMGKHISPWEGNVSIGLKRNYTRESAAGIGTKGSKRPCYFYVKAMDLYKYLSGNDVLVLEEFSYFNSETRSTEDHIYISPSIVEEWADSMEKQLKRTLWEGNVYGKLSSYRADSMHVKRALRNIVKTYPYLVEVYDEDSVETLEPRERTMLELRLHAVRQPAAWKDNLVNRFVSHLGFTIQEENDEGEIINTPISNTLIEELRKVLTEKQERFLILAVTHSGRRREY